MEVVLLNSPGATEVMAHLLEFDSTHGKFSHPITFDKDWIDIGTGQTKVTHERDPASCRMPNWMLMWCWNVQAILTAARNHLHIWPQGLKKVLVSAPASGADFTVFMGLTTVCAPNGRSCLMRLVPQTVWHRWPR